MSSGNLLLLEGADDSNVLYHLLRRYRIDIADRDNLVEGRVTLKSVGGVDILLDTLRVQLKLQDNDSPVARIGVVIDADTSLEARWQALRTILQGAGYMAVPNMPDQDGTILIEEDRVAVGIWLMPDNQLPGAIERFAQFLLPADDHLWGHADLSVQQIPEADRLFPMTDLLKAHLHTWLAWQTEPGVPMGQAIRKGFLDADAPHARRLIDWIRRLFSLAA